MSLSLPFVGPRRPLVPVLRMHGAIAAGAQGRLSDAALAPMIEKAFRRGRPAAVALALNSPGGSPAQSSLIAARIRRLSKETGVPVFAFVEDVAASGGYWLATAADEIWADSTSIIGSIGVISAGFGFQDLIAKAGIERRLHTTGRDKSLLDPFRPERPEDVARLKRIQSELYEAFVAQVKVRRGARLDETAELFDGDIWTGETALKLGLIDGIGHLVPEMKRRFGDRVRFRVLQQKRPFLSRFGLRMAEGALAAAEDRLAFARWGV